MTRKHSPAMLVLLLFPIPVWAGQLLTNGGFETGNLDGWTVTAGNAVVVEQSATDFFNPNEPRSGDWMISTSDADVNNPGDQVSFEQSVTIGAGAPACAKIMASGYFAGATANGVSSDDLAQIEIRFLDGNITLGTVSTAAIDPEVGSWNELRLDNILVPGETDTIVFNVITFLDPGFNSIDILGDDFELTLVAADDTDGDTVSDCTDNCVSYANPLQVDNDADGIGNACDPDGAPETPGDCLVNFADLSQMKQVFFGTDPVYDLTGLAGDPDGVVNFADLGRMKALFFADFSDLAQNPSGIANACSP